MIGPSIMELLGVRAEVAALFALVTAPAVAAGAVLGLPIGSPAFYAPLGAVIGVSALVVLHLMEKREQNA